MSKRRRNRNHSQQPSEPQAVVEPHAEVAVEPEAAEVAEQSAVDSKPEPASPSGAQFDPDFDFELDLDEHDSPRASRLRRSLAFDGPLEAEPIPLPQFQVFDGSPGPTTMKWKREAERKAAAEKAEAEGDR